MGNIGLGDVALEGTDNINPIAKIIISTGNIGMANLNPTSILHVNGNVSVKDFSPSEKLDVSEQITNSKNIKFK
jgi:hypothetical protein